MAQTRMTSREFNRDVARAKRAARDGPVIITDRDRPAHVLMTWEEYGRVTGQPRTLADALYWPGAGGIDFEPERLRDDIGLRIPTFDD